MMIIKNALIHDAIHEEPFYGDIVIENGKIVSVGGDAGKDGDVIDAEGLHAYPGFVDAHSHIGIEDRAGSLEAGKDADVVLTDGDPMVSDTVVRYVIADGKVLVRHEQQ
jgi:imidazolonepropionase-like amidohydrolase